MNRITSQLTQLKNSGHCALVPYITAGDPTPDLTVPLLHALVRAGANILELGIPFSDPMADGPVIEQAHQRALKQGISLQKVLAMVSLFRQTDKTTPIVLMGYLNPFEKFGYKQFAQAAQAAGVDGVLAVDLPPEEATEWLQHLTTHQIDPIFLIAPTTQPERIIKIVQHAKGYLYYVSLKGVTGSSQLDINHVAAKLAWIRALTTMPIAVGFGIHDAHSAAEVAKIADAVIVGSALVSQIAQLIDKQELICDKLGQFLHEMRVAIDKN